MKYTYYPGCTLKTKAKQLDLYAKKCLQALGVEFEEFEDWQCCGGVYPNSKDEIAPKLSSVRTLTHARDNNSDLITVCAACHNVIKRVNEDVRTDEYTSSRVNSYTQAENPYKGEVNVLHYLELLRDVVGFDNLKKAVKNPVKLKIAAYYGCLLLRPGSVMQFDNPENPTIIEDFIKAIGGEAVISPYRNECCGAYVTLQNPQVASSRAGQIIDSCAKKGANMIITACPLCMYNLKKHEGESIPVVYFTEILAEALGVK